MSGAEDRDWSGANRALLERIEDLRRKLYRGKAKYEEQPELHQELDQLIVRYMKLRSSR
ncbi:MAG: hypothetical protein HYY08_02735 [Firmicutes bacterium]|nr:hypothetical protein [Bacillota bacterium]